MDVNNLFSREALDKMRSPEKLDTMLKVTTPIGWMGLAAVMLMLLSVVLWSVFGAFTVKAEGMGMIMDSGGVVAVSHTAPGKISELYIRTGGRVERGDIIGRMEQDEQTAKTYMARQDMRLAKNDQEAQGRASQYDANNYQEGIGREIYSDYDGIVDEVMVKKGHVINAGEPICIIRRNQERDDLTGVLYVPVDKGKRIQQGMTLQLAPNGVDVSESGSLIGVVRSVSQYPVTQNGIQKELGNNHLAQWILTEAAGSVVEVRFDLVKDETSKSGYLWTSLTGEHKEVTPGSFCRGSVIIERKPPIEKVFYKLSQWLRSR